MECHRGRAGDMEVIKASSRSRFRAPGAICILE